MRNSITLKELGILAEFNPNLTVSEILETLKNSPSIERNPNSLKNLKQNRKAPKIEESLEEQEKRLISGFTNQFSGTPTILNQETNEQVPVSGSYTSPQGNVYQDGAFLGKTTKQIDTEDEY